MNSAVEDIAPLHQFTGHRDSPQAYRDWLGVAASTLCAIHCAAMPFVVGFLPLLGLSFLAEPSFHKWMVGICLALALLAFVPGWRRHRRLQPTVIGLFGLILISLAAFAGPEDCCPTHGTVLAPPGDTSVQAVSLAGDTTGASSCCPSEGAVASTSTEPVSEAVALDDESSYASSFCPSEGAVAGRPVKPVVIAHADGAVCTDSCCPTEAAAADTHSAGATRLFWALMTPLGGVFLVVGHLYNRHWSGQCTAGRCTHSMSEQLPA